MESTPREVSSRIASPSVGVREFEPRDTDRWLRLFHSTFGRERTGDHLEWMMSPPAGPTTMSVLEVEGELVGAGGATPRIAHHGGQEVRTWLGVDAMIEEAHRGREGLDLLREHGRRKKLGGEVRLSFPADHVARRLEGRANVEVSVMPQWVRWLTSRGLRHSRPTLPIALANALVLAHRALLPVRVPRGVGSVSRQDLGPGFDRLAERSQTWFESVGDRSAAHLAWRWFDHPSGPRRMLAATGPSGVDGYAVVDLVAPRGGTVDVRVGRVVDLLAGDGRTMRRLLTSAVASLRDEGADLVTFTVQDPRPWSANAIRRAGFLRRGRGPNVTSTAFTDVGRDMALSGWYLTLGDSDLC